MKLKEQINELVDTLNGHPLLKVFEKQQSSAIDPAKFNAFKETYGFDVPESIRNVYAEVNGFKIVYGLKDDSDEGLAKFNAASKDYVVEKGPPYIIGSIKFLSFEESFLGDTWRATLYDIGSESDKDKFVFRNREYMYNEFGKQLKPFDLFSEETCAVFLLTLDERFEVMLLTDHYADWKNSRIISFEDYWSLVFLTGGIIEARERYLSKTNGDELPKMDLPDSRKIKPHVFSG